MKNVYMIQLLFIGLLSVILSCDGKKSPFQINELKENDQIDFCKMYKEDQSYTEYDKSDTVGVRIGEKKRREIFEKNFNLLITYLKKNNSQNSYEGQSPNLNSRNRKEEKCKESAMHITFLHSMQYFPKKFFAADIVELFASALNKGSFERHNLIDGLEFVFIQNEFCEELRPSITNALRKWNIKKEELRQWVEYKKC